MSENKKSVSIGAAFIIRALICWLLAALILLPAASLIVCKTDVGEQALAYISSALSFLCAFFAGLAALRGESGGVIYKALLSAGAIVLVLLTLGYLFEGSSLKASSVLSLVSFSFSGCLLGAVMSPVSRPRVRRKKLDSKR